MLDGALVIGPGGEFLVQKGDVELNGAVTNDALIEAQDGAVIDLAGTIGGSGTIVVDGAYLNAQVSVIATQAITIEGAAVVHLTQPEGGQITFSGAGMLALDAAPAGGVASYI